MLESFRKELDKRKVEKQEAEAAIKREKERLAQRRANAEKNFIRKKVKVVDKLSTAREERRDEKHLAEFRAEQAKKVEAARAERRNQAINKHKGKLITGGVIAAVAVFAACFIGGHIQEQQVLDD